MVPAWQHRVECRYNAVQYCKITLIIAETEAKNKSDAGSTKDTPYFALTGELWGVFCEHLWENWPRYSGIVLYSFLQNTTVTITAEDSSGNSAVCAFDVAIVGRWSTGNRDTIQYKDDNWIPFVDIKWLKENITHCFHQDNPTGDMHKMHLIEECSNGQLFMGTENYSWELTVIRVNGWLFLRTHNLFVPIDNYSLF